jgi:predicted RNase H-like nuclease
MAVVLGVDGCPGNGWVALSAGPEGLRWHLAVGAAQLLELADSLGAASVAVDIPIGLTEAGPRDCDTAARAFLGGRAAATVFPAPARAVLGVSSYAEARAVQPSLSAQAYGLVARIRDVDQVCAGDERFVECHPETSFRVLTGQVLDRKKTAAGALQRVAALTATLGALPSDVPAGARLDDALDAAVCAWSAGRIARGQARAFGGEDRDRRGRPMRVWA